MVVALIGIPILLSTCYMSCGFANVERSGTNARPGSRLNTVPGHERFTTDMVTQDWTWLLETPLGIVDFIASLHAINGVVGVAGQPGLTRVEM